MWRLSQWKIPPIRNSLHCTFFWVSDSRNFWLGPALGRSQAREVQTRLWRHQRHTGALPESWLPSQGSDGPPATGTFCCWICIRESYLFLSYRGEETQSLFLMGRWSSSEPRAEGDLPRLGQLHSYHHVIAGAPSAQLSHMAPCCVILSLGHVSHSLVPVNLVDTQLVFTRWDLSKPWVCKLWVKKKTFPKTAHQENATWHCWSSVVDRGQLSKSLNGLWPLYAGIRSMHGQGSWVENRMEEIAQFPLQWAASVAKLTAI